MIKNFPDVRQTDHYSCGAAASMAVGLYYGVGPKTLPEWKKALCTDVQESTKPQAIIDYFEKLGLQVDAKQYMPMQELAENIDNGFPTICPVQDYGNKKARDAKFDYGHYLVVIGLYNDYVICQDSSEDNVIAGSESAQEPGKIIISCSDWGHIWHDKDIMNQRYIHYGITISKKFSAQ